MGLIQKAFSDIITFSRSSNATRIGPTGRVEYAPHNLILQSQTFDNASWTKNASTVTANAIAAPDGTVTADKIVENTAGGTTHNAYQSIVLTAASHTLSFYAKAAGRSWVFANWAASGNNGIYFDVANGVIGTISSGYTGSITSVGNGWYRCTVTVTASAATWYVEFDLATANGTVSYTGDGTSGIYLWGAQLSVGPYPLDYTPTTSAAVYGPRFDYDPVTLAARGLLVEEQRTNLITYSEQFGSWSLSGGSVSSNTAVSPDGQTTADTYTITGAGEYLYQSATVTASTTYTASIFVKAGTKSNFRLWYTTGGFGTYVYVDVNPSAGTIGAAQSAGGATAAAASIQALSNGWYRVTLTGNLGAVTNAYVVIGNDSGTGTVLLWGAQLE